VFLVIFLFSVLNWWPLLVLNLWIYLIFSILCHVIWEISFLESSCFFLSFCMKAIDMYGAGFGISGWKSDETLGFIIFGFIIFFVILLATLVEFLETGTIWNLEVWRFGCWAFDFNDLIIFFYYGCLWVIAVDYWTYCEALGFITFPFTIFLVCLIWNVCSLSYWSDDRKVHVSVAVYLSNSYTWSPIIESDMEIIGPKIDCSFSWVLGFYREAKQ